MFVSGVISVNPRFKVIQEFKIIDKETIEPSQVKKKNKTKRKLQNLFSVHFA